MLNVIDIIEYPPVIEMTLDTDEREKVLELLDGLGLKQTAAQFREDQDDVWACYVIYLFLDTLAAKQ